MQNDPYPSMQAVQPKSKSWIMPAILGFFLVASLAFAVWAYLGMSDYKNNSDKKSAEAVEAALTQQKKKLDLEYEEKDKYPYESYQAEDKLAALSLSYPKTWELYVDSRVTASTSSLDGYAHPKFVPGVSSDTAFALRFQLTTRDFETEKKTLDSGVKAGRIKSEPFRPEKLPTVIGVKYTGEIVSKRTGILYILPTRDKSIKIWTESTTYGADLDQIMKTINFAP